MSKSPTLVFNFRVGGSKLGDQARPAFVGRQFTDFLRERAEKKGSELLLETLVRDQIPITESIKQDARTFGTRAARVFTRVQSPESGGVSVSLNDINRNVVVTERLKGKSTVEWVALTQRTLKNKRRRAALGRRGGSAREPNTFFVDTGDLRKVLRDHLGDAFALLIDPKITFREGPRKVSATISIMSRADGSAKASVTQDTFPGGGAGGVARNETLFVRYLQRAGARDDRRHPMAYKLDNPRGQHRPFLQNTLVFWISNRLPLAFDAALKKAISRNKGR